MERRRGRLRRYCKDTVSFSALCNVSCVFWSCIFLALSSCVGFKGISFGSGSHRRSASLSQRRSNRILPTLKPRYSVKKSPLRFRLMNLPRLRMIRRAPPIPAMSLPFRLLTPLEKTTTRRAMPNSKPLTPRHPLTGKLPSSTTQRLSKPRLPLLCSMPTAPTLF